MYLRVFVLFCLISIIFAQNYGVTDKLRGVYIMGAFGDAYGTIKNNFFELKKPDPFFQALLRSKQLSRVLSQIIRVL